MRRGIPHQSQLPQQQQQLPIQRQGYPLLVHQNSFPRNINLRNLRLPLSDPSFNFGNIGNFDSINPFGRKRKRELSPIKSYQCPICRQILTNPMSTPCQHTFCATCVERTVKITTSCPVCKKNIPKNEFKPNPEMKKIADDNKLEFYLTKFLSMHGFEETSENYDYIIHHFQRNYPEFNNKDKIKEVIKTMTDEAKLLKFNQKNIVTKEFLKCLMRRRIEEAKDAIERCNDTYKNLKLLTKFENDPNIDINTINDIYNSQPNFNVVSKIDIKFDNDILKPEQKQILSKHFNFLSDEYKRREDIAKIETRQRRSSNMFEFEPKRPVHIPSGKVDLNEFSSIIDGICKYNYIKNRGTMVYTKNIANNNGTISSIDFDKDGEYFVIAGTANKMKFYEFDTVIKDPENTKPLKIIHNNYRTSNVCWNPEVKQLLASSDYMGGVMVWDTEVGKTVAQYREHGKRCWSVQFNNINPSFMASGADDAKVKLYDITNAYSIGTIDAKVQVCCVHFNPKKEFELVYGGSDHCIYVYDIRNLLTPVKTFVGHRKSVSYIKFMDSKHVISASTDSTLRVWDITKDVKAAQETILSGHYNEKHFVGLATNGEHIVCGSESNAVYTYYQSSQQPICHYDFYEESLEELRRGALSHSRLPPESNNQPEYISAVCWKKDSNIIMAANNNGKAHILQLYPLGYSK